jgi:hypothetical protein
MIDNAPVYYDHLATFIREVERGDYEWECVKNHLK